MHMSLYVCRYKFCENPKPEDTNANTLTTSPTQCPAGSLYPR